MNSTVFEDLIVNELTATLARSPRQVNASGESDSELISLAGSDQLLAVTTDSIVEEVESGLYADPELIGWMTVAVNLSDLAAVGAVPLGLVLNVTFSPDCPANFLTAFRSGVNAACRAGGTAVLGGDTNFSAHVQFGGTAFGLIEGGRPLTRRGAKPGDILLSSGPLGAGSAYALQRLKLDTEGPFRPAARLIEGRLVRRFASCAMDTSDGLLPALDQLARINEVGFEIDLQTRGVLDAGAESLALASGIPSWMMLAGPHGEFELVFTLGPDRLGPFLSEASQMGWEPVKLGRVVEKEGVDLLRQGTRTSVDTAAIRNLAATAGSDVDQYLAGLVRIGS